MLFRGEDIPRQGAQGLMWLTAYQECAQAEYTGIALEYGTLPIDRMIGALRAQELDIVGDGQRGLARGAFVEHRRGHRRDAELARHIGARAREHHEIRLHERHLVLLDALRAPLALGHSAAYGESIAALERHWFAPLLAAALTVGLKRGGLLMSLLVLPLYMPTLIFGAEVVKRGAAGLAVGTPLALLAGITAGALALLPIAAAAAIRVNLR